ncbi:MAG: fluoride efflux transporter CrcB [Cyanobacteria bacterium P01_H01_bin.15]
MLRAITHLLTIAPDLVPDIFQRPQFTNPLAVSMGAIGGALSRYYLSLWFVQRFSPGFPYATLIVNFLGCFGMGLVVTLASERIFFLSTSARLLVAVGFLGSFTTFSTYELDAFNLLQARSLTLFSFYWLGSALFGIVCIFLGESLARVLAEWLG